MSWPGVPLFLGYPQPGTGIPPAYEWDTPCPGLGYPPPHLALGYSHLRLGYPYLGVGIPQEGTWDQWKYCGIEMGGGVPPSNNVEQTDTCENITSSRTTYAGGNYNIYVIDRCSYIQV